MRLIPLTSEFESQFWNVVEMDYCDYYFFIYDWLLQRAKTRIFLAQENDVVKGLMVLYDGYISQLRGDKLAVKFMLGNLALQFTEVQVPLSCEDLLLEKYPSAKLKANVTLMRLDKGHEQLAIKVKPQKLAVNDAAGIVELMHVCYPKMWRDIPKEAAEAIFAYNEALWLGIKDNNKLVAFGYAMLTPKTCHVTWIGTNPKYERRGYATSIVSALVQECLAVSDTAIIYVLNDNSAANGVYSRVGFKPYKQYAFVKN